MSCPEVKEVWPVPPLDTERVPVVSDIAIPKDEVANCCHEPPEYEPRRTPAAAGDDIPVPPEDAPRGVEMVRDPPMVALLDTLRAEVEAKFETERYVVVD